MKEETVLISGLVYKIGLRGRAFYQGIGGKWVSSSMAAASIKQALAVKYESERRLASKWIIKRL
tara:strand:+ start:181 stop:372 length:192 start_codon:yes stop_codon:yes gene_type:complete